MSNIKSIEQWNSYKEHSVKNNKSTTIKITVLRENQGSTITTLCYGYEILDKYVDITVNRIILMYKNENVIITKNSKVLAKSNIVRWLKRDNCCPDFIVMYAKMEQIDFNYCKNSYIDECWIFDCEKIEDDMYVGYVVQEGRKKLVGILNMKTKYVYIFCNRIKNFKQGIDEFREHRLGILRDIIPQP